MDWQHASQPASLINLTGLHHISDTIQHADLGESQKHRDWTDLHKVCEFIDVNNPFEGCNERLSSIASGLTASNTDYINCDEADRVGADIMTVMDNMAFQDVSIKKASTIRPLSALRFNERMIPTHCSTSFMSREDNLEPFFSNRN